jgi:acrylyl-CoA reductase (NADPH)
VTNYRGFRIHQDTAGHHAGVESLARREPAEGEVLIRVAWSGINYKDALAGTGKGRILKTFPLVGGIDAAGHVERSGSPAFREGDPVLVTGYGLSFDYDGGFAEYLCCPADWVLPIPAGLDPHSAMILGTAGFTAALALHRMLVNGQHPGLGPILVTGASGGVGAIAVNLFSHLGFEVAAVSGKTHLHDWLRSLGARRVLGRNDLPGDRRPLERAVWGGAVDNVGGEMLAQITRTLATWGNIASIGLAGGHELHTTVMPFILRGVSLLGIHSVEVPQPLRGELWAHLATDWRPPQIEAIHSATVGLDGLAGIFEQMLRGQTHGRVLVHMSG